MCNRHLCSISYLHLPCLVDLASVIDDLGKHAVTANVQHFELELLMIYGGCYNAASAPVYETAMNWVHAVESITSARMRTRV